MTKNDWNTQLYDNKHSYVFKLGEEVFQLLNPKQGEEILDLGCGTGHLTGLISKTGANVLGIDNSIEMIEQARLNYPELMFDIKDATNFSFEEKFDAVFSNAVLHWISEKEKVIDCIYNCLKNKGRFVAEFGGKGNVSRVVSSIKKVLGAGGYADNTKCIDWYFPSLGEYASLLEKHGFRVTYAIHFDRDTYLDEGVDVVSWLDMFAKKVFEEIEPSKKAGFINQIKQELALTNYSNNKWFIDYKRLRISAVKE